MDKKEFLKLEPNDYIISLANVGPRKIADIFKVIKTAYNAVYYQPNTCTSSCNTIRRATQQEINWHLQNPSVNRNITNMPKEPVINNNYSIY